MIRLIHEAYRNIQYQRIMTDPNFLHAGQLSINWGLCGDRPLVC